MLLTKAKTKQETINEYPSEFIDYEIHLPYHFFNYPVPITIHRDNDTGANQRRTTKR